jgi:hypothetical protein
MTTMTIEQDGGPNRLIVYVIGAALFAGGLGLKMMAKAQQAPAFIAEDRPVTAEQLREKLQTDGWSNIVISRSGRYLEVTGSRDGQAGKMAVDSETGRLRASIRPARSTVTVTLRREAARGARAAAERASHWIPGQQIGP